MNKDAILATIIGFGIGLLITGTLVLGPSVFKSIPAVTLPKISLPTIRFPSVKKTQDTTTPTPTPHLTVTIDSPLAEAVEENSEVLVSGKTLPGSIVVVESPENEDVVTVNGDGGYAGKVTLVEGKNDITVAAYRDGSTISQTVTVFYTPEEF